MLIRSGLTRDSRGRVIAAEVCVDQAPASQEAIYEVQVPLGVAFHPWVHAPSFAIRDQLGLEVPGASQAPGFTLSTGVSSRSFVWAVQRR